MSPEKMWRPGKVAELLQVSPKTLSRWVKEGKVAHKRTLGGAIGRGHTRIPDSEVTRLVELFDAGGLAEPVPTP